MLDLGCGAGDVTFVAADLVGPDGFVVGVDRSPDTLARARLRAEQRGLTQVQFVEGDINDPAPGGLFDAMVERLVLWLVPGEALVLMRINVHICAAMCDIRDRAAVAHGACVAPSRYAVTAMRSWSMSCSHGSGRDDSRCSPWTTRCAQAA